MAQDFQVARAVGRLKIGLGLSRLPRKKGR